MLLTQRPDIAFSVNRLSRYLSAPTLLHWQAAKRILRYLKGTIDYSLHFKSSTRLNLSGYCDANWGVSHEDRRLVAGFCVFLKDSLISCSSKKQNIVSRSSTESE